MIEAGPARLQVDTDRGARLSSLTLWGNEVLATDQPDSVRWGCYPMVPWAGRVRDGRFSFDGAHYQLPINFGDHAIHGTVFDTEWQATGDGYEVELAQPWPFPGRVRQRVGLTPESLTLELELHADVPMPASMGWHPWFHRWIDGAGLGLEIEAQWMERRDEAGIPSGERLQRPFPSPSDDCLGGVAQPVLLRWQGLLEVELTSS